MQDITTLAIDIAKNKFQLHGFTKTGKRKQKKTLTRSKLIEFMSNLPPVTVGLEACGGSHHWARKFTDLGHEVKMISPQYVKPYVKTNKNDSNDADAIGEAMSRPNMQFVTHKTVEQQDIQSLHRIRSHYISQRTAIMNMLRGLIAEYGVVCQPGKANLYRTLVDFLDEAQEGSELTARLKPELMQIRDDVKRLDERIAHYDKLLSSYAKDNAICRRLLTVSGVGPITATSYYSVVGDGKTFSNGRHVAAYLGLVPRQSSSGNKERLLGISKRGDRYLRTMLIHGARSCLKSTMMNHSEDKHSCWIRDLIARCGWNKATVALANKNARIMWALIHDGTDFQAALAH